MLDIWVGAACRCSQLLAALQGHSHTVGNAVDHATAVASASTSRSRASRVSFLPWLGAVPLDFVSHRCESLLLRAAMLRLRFVFSLDWTPESHALFVESDRQIITMVGRVLLLVAKRKPRYGVNDDVVFAVVRRCA